MSAFDIDEEDKLRQELPKGYFELNSREIVNIMDESTADQLEETMLKDIVASIKNQDMAYLNIKFNSDELEIENIERNFENILDEEGNPTNIYISEYEEGKPNFIFNSFKKPESESGHTIKLYIVRKPVNSMVAFKSLVNDQSINECCSPIGYFSIDHKGNYLMYIIAGVSIVLLLIIIFLMTRKKKDNYY